MATTTRRRWAISKPTPSTTTRGARSSGPPSVSLPKRREWLAALPQLAVDDVFTMVHGSPRDPTWEYVFSTSVARDNLGSFETTHCLVGHTHIPMVFRERGEGVEAVQPIGGRPVRLGELRVIANPGSVGQPRDGDPRASAMLLDTDKRSLEWRRVEYPIERVQKLMAERRLPARLAARLPYGL